MANIDEIHVIPAAGGEWQVRADGDATSSVHPTQGLAVAKAWELVRTRTAAEVIVHGPDGAIQSNLTIRRHVPMPADEEFLGENEEEAFRRAAMKMTPGRAELRALIERLPASSIDYSGEDDELPC